MEMLKMCLQNSSILIFLLLFVIIQLIQAKDESKGSNKHKNQDGATAILTTPSPEWLEYQRERFSNAKDVESIRKMLDPASQLLKNQKDQVVSPQPTQLVEHSNKHSTHVEETVGNTHKVEATTSDDDNKSDDDDNDDDDDDEKRSKEGNSNLLMYAIKDIKYPTLRGFIGFLKRLKRSWFKQSAKTIEQRVSDLKRLKTKLMFLIEDRFNIIWAPKEYARRSKRGLLEESNLNFPPEAALMSINFLTFAVFLIKLVLQVVHIIKSKHYKLSGLGLGLTDTDTMTKVV
ncbi:uncharacterized protein [Eurosta solidaginis]|uniref:uncharacterized protein n=1 Tax=Eurosta solidaginis TaxID=178769 RepID=UPI0035310730